jgi:serine protease Do
MRDDACRAPSATPRVSDERAVSRQASKSEVETVQRLYTAGIFLLGIAFALGCVGALGILGHQVSSFPAFGATGEPGSPSQASEVRGADLAGDITASRVNAIVRAAREVGPAVVSISVIQTRIYTVSPFSGPFRDPYFDQLWRDFFPPRRYREEVMSQGSGVIIDPEGYILTNDHVVHGAEEIKVTLADGRSCDGTLVGTDPYLDLALVKIEGEAIPHARLGDSDDLIIGEWAIAIGNPFGYFLEDTQPTVTVGVISALHRAIKSSGRSQELQIYADMVQTDAAINPGNSGGPLVNAAGEVIGINTFIFTSGGGSEGVGFARPINAARKVLAELKEYGRVRVAWLGIRVQELTPLLGESLKITDLDGLLVANIARGSPAEKAGVERGDVIRTIDGTPVASFTDWQVALLTVRVGETVRLQVEREGRARTYSVEAVEYRGE